MITDGIREEEELNFTLKLSLDFYVRNISTKLATQHSCDLLFMFLDATC